mgnify:CR=1 FL=1
MDLLIYKAKLILSRFFKVHQCHFEKNKSRKVKVIEARRFLCYYLRNELNLSFKQITEQIPAITNHATAIHHCKKLQELFFAEKKLQSKYNSFLRILKEDADFYILTEIKDLHSTRSSITSKINKLKKLLITKKPKS